jgi:N-acetylmuramoyl-L-alanine amidase
MDLDLKVEPVPYADRLAERELNKVDTVVIHCTELPDPALCREYACREIHPSGTGNCGHYYIDRSGGVAEYVPLDRVAHHVRGHNEESVGIELINRGRYPDWYHSENQEMTEPYTEAQYVALEKLLGCLKGRLERLGRLVGHSELDREWVEATDAAGKKVRRKVDPGPLFDWERIRKLWKGL